MNIRLVSICTGLIIMGLVFANASNADIDPETILGIWLLDEDEGDIAEDSSGNGHDGKIMNAPKLVEGKFGEALEFDAADDYVDFGNAESLKPQQFTVMAWVNPRRAAAPEQIIFQSGQNWNDMAGFFIRVNKNGVVQGALASGPGNTSTFVGGPAPSVEEWNHLAFTFDGTDAILYLNGEQVGKGTATEVHYDDKPIRIGSHPEGVSGLFDGSIDEVALFNAALTQDDIKSIMNEGLEVAIQLFAVSSAGKIATKWASIRK